MKYINTLGMMLTASATSMAAVEARAGETIGFNTALQANALQINPVDVAAQTAALDTGSSAAAEKQSAPPAVSSSEETADSQNANDIVVTATRRSQSQQRVPLALTAFSSDQLETRHVNTIADLSYSIPNISLKSIGSTPGIANFMIRGLGISGSLPSVEPTVGVFVDEMYLGVNQGVLFNSFDIQAVEILRGPQGTLFGRNATAGAVLIRTKLPTDELYANLSSSYESGDNRTISGVISGPIAGKLKARLGVYYNDDAGWFTNEFDGSRLGASHTFIVRPTLEYTDDGLDIILRYERGRSSGDGPTGQNNLYYPRDSFKMGTSFPGFYKNNWDQVIQTSSVNVGPGDGKITNVFAWRRLISSTGSDYVGDLPGSVNDPLLLFTDIRQRQISDELRYNAKFGKIDLTAGLFYFHQVFSALQRRLISNATTDVAFGGTTRADAYAAFANIDYSVTSNLTLSAGLRYTHENKEVEIATSAATGRCNYLTRSCHYDFNDSHSWDDASPKFGVQYYPVKNLQLYGSWSKAFRSGGYNIGAANINVPPGPVNPEHVQNYELGSKWSFLPDGHVNVALFHTIVSDLQRAVSVPSALGTTQTILNTANATLNGVEVEIVMPVTRSFSLTAYGGYTEDKYDKILNDLTGDGKITNADYQLQLPRLVPWSYGAGARYRADIGNGNGVTLSTNFGHQNWSYANDSNTRRLNGANILDGDITLNLKMGLSYSFYFRNLFNEITEGDDVDFGKLGNFRALNKGRVFGGSIKYTL